MSLLNKQNLMIFATAVLAVIVIKVFIRKIMEKKTQEQCERAFKMKLSDEQKESVNAILKAWNRYGNGDEWVKAYIFATARHESRLAPVREGFTKSAEALQKHLEDNNREYGKGENRGFGGRGFIQLTWKSNYVKVGKLLGIDLVSNPEKALDMDIAATILVRGMTEGWFGIKEPIYTYIDTKAGRRDLLNARRTVNGRDKDQLIADYATAFYNAGKTPTA